MRVTLCGHGAVEGLALLPLYNRALERHGCDVEKGRQQQAEITAGLFAIGNSLSALEKRRQEAERQAQAQRQAAAAAAATAAAAAAADGAQAQ